MHQKFRFVVALFAAMPAFSSFAQDSVPCAEAIKKQESTARAYSAKVEDFNEENPAFKEPQACVGGAVRWERTSLSLNIPEFKNKKVAWKMDVPETTMKTKEWVVEEPIVRCENKTVGQTPHVTCRTRNFIPQCTTTWTDIITRVCWPETRDKRVSLSVPEVRMRARSFNVDVPEATMKTRTMSLHLPQFYPDSGCLGRECGELCKAQLDNQIAETEQARSSYLSDAKKDLLLATGEMFACNSDQLSKQKESSLAEYDKYISVAEATLQAMLSQSLLEPAKEQEKQLIEMKAARQRIAEQLDKSLKDMQDQAQKTMDQLGGA